MDDRKDINDEFRQKLEKEEREGMDALKRGIKYICGECNSFVANEDNSLFHKNGICTIKVVDTKTK